MHCCPNCCCPTCGRPYDRWRPHPWVRPLPPVRPCPAPFWVDSGGALARARGALTR